VEGRRRRGRPGAGWTDTHRQRRDTQTDTHTHPHTHTHTHADTHTSGVSHGEQPDIIPWQVASPPATAANQLRRLPSGAAAISSQLGTRVHRRLGRRQSLPLQDTLARAKHWQNLERLSLLQPLTQARPRRLFLSAPSPRLLPTHHAARCPVVSHFRLWLDTHGVGRETWIKDKATSPPLVACPRLLLISMIPHILLH